MRGSAEQSRSSSANERELQRLGPSRLVEIAWARFHDGDLPACEDLCTRARVRWPSNARFQFLEARIALARGRSREAVELLGIAAPRLPDSHEAFFLLGSTCLALGRTDEAIVALGASIQRLPEHARALEVLQDVLIRAGRLADAEVQFEAIARRHPRAAVAQLVLGMTKLSVGKLEAARVALKAAIAAMPEDWRGHYLLGLSRLKAAQFSDAAVHLRKALDLNGKSSDAHVAMAQALLEMKEPARALGHASMAVDFSPRRAAPHAIRAAILDALGRWTEAREHLVATVEYGPVPVDLAVLMGVLWTRAGDPARAAAAYEQAVAATPENTFLRLHLGAALVMARCYGDATRQFEAVLAREPDSVQGLSNLAWVLMLQGDFDAAVRLLDSARVVDPNSADVLANYGCLQVQLDDADAAVTSLEQALRIDPTHTTARFNRTLVTLRRGALADGWEDYALSRQLFNAAPVPAPIWNGEHLGGRTVLLVTEQGFGDNIHFVRYAREIKSRGGRVICDPPEPLRRLLCTCPWIDEVGEPGRFDLCAPIPLLPAILRVPAIAPIEPYLFAEPSEAAAWRERMGTASPAFRVGVVWRGGTGFLYDRDRSVTLSRFAPLASVPGVQLFSLQVGSGREELQSAPFPIVDLTDDLPDFAATAAAIASLDLVISVDTATAHLAGALHVPVWTLLPRVNDWRWFEDRSDTPWYPTMRLFRQSARGEWDPVFAQAADALRERVGRDGETRGSRK